MKIAIVDMGTNTFHLILAEVKETSHEIFHKERIAVKIGKEGISQNRITDDAWKRALDTLSHFKNIIDGEDVEKVFATATSAIRNAANGLALTKEIERLTGIETAIISGDREAQLILQGARNALDIGDKKHLIMDIGGGSIEFIIADANETYWLQSFEIGGQRLVDKFHNNDPISSEEIENLEDYFETELDTLIENWDLHKPETLVGCSGTFDTLSDIHCAREKCVIEEDQTELPLTLESYLEIHKELISMTRSERLNIPGMIEMRVDMIVVASVLINYLIKRFQLKKLRVSAYALKEGVLFDTIASVRNSMKPN